MTTSTPCATLSVSEVKYPIPEPVNIWHGTGHRYRALLYPYPAAEPGAPSCVVCPGGSYFWLDRHNESHAAARWLQSNGINAFVLNYRTAGIPAYIFPLRLTAPDARAMRPLDDIYQAIKVIRTGGDEWNVTPQSMVGVMGFSAGGHAALFAALYDDGVSVKPDFVAAIYPVVSMVAPWTHARSRRGLVGDMPGRYPHVLDALSIERALNDTMPPVFLVHCKDDRVVDWRNSGVLNEALNAWLIPHRFLLYNEGGHGFGVNDAMMPHPTRRWKTEFLSWLQELQNH